MTIHSAKWFCWLRSISLPLTIALTVTGCFDAEQGNGEPGKEDRTISEAFTKVASVGCPEKVRVDVVVDGGTSTDARHVTVSGDSNLVGSVVSAVQNSELVISCQGSIQPKLDLSVVVHALKLEALRSDASGELSLDGANADGFVIQHSGSGKMTVKNLQATTLKVQAEGSINSSIEALGLTSLYVNVLDSSKVALTGNAKSMDVTGSGTGSLAAFGLQTDTTHASLVDSSSALVCAKASVNGAVIESGRLEYDCQPMTVDVSVKDEGVLKPR